MCGHTQHLSMSSGRLNSGPHAWWASTLPTGLQPGLLTSALRCQWLCSCRPEFQDHIYAQHSSASSSWHPQRSRSHLIRSLTQVSGASLEIMWLLQLLLGRACCGLPRKASLLSLQGPNWPSSGKLPSGNQPCLQSLSVFGIGEPFLKGQPVPELTQAERVAWPSFSRSVV